MIEASSNPKQRTTEEIRADMDKLSRVVLLAMQVLDKHPETQRVKDGEDKVIEKKLDEASSPDGKSKVWLRIGPSKSRFHVNQPVTSVTVEKKLSEEEIEDKKEKGVVGGATRYAFYADGKIEIDYEYTKDRLDKTAELIERDASEWEFEEEDLGKWGYTIDTKDVNTASHDTDWGTVDDAGRALAEILSNIES